MCRMIIGLMVKLETQISNIAITIPYSLKFSRVKIFEDFEDFGLALKILTLKILVLHKHLSRIHENFFLKEKLLNLEIFNLRKF